MTTTEQIGVMIVDDHSIMRAGLEAVLRDESQFEVVGHAKDGVEAVEVAISKRPDVIIMDILMPNKDGIEACREILEQLPETRVLILTASNDEDLLVQAVAAGATGYLQKYTDKDQLLSTIREVHAGEFRIPGELIRRVIDARREQPTTSRGPSELGVLTARELEILRLFAQGNTYNKIADVLGNRPLTVRNAIYRMRDKLGVKTRQEMLVWAVQKGLLEEE